MDLNEKAEFVNGKTGKVFLHWDKKALKEALESDDDIELVDEEIINSGLGITPVENRLIHGDNLLVMKALIDDGLEGQIDLIYIDPPFWSGEDYYTSPIARASPIPAAKNQLAYRDKWKGGLASYLKMIYPRLLLMRRLLSDEGSLFVHVDWHAGHYVKIILDEIFGMKNLRNEIIWHYGGPSPVKTYFPRKHDVIFFYSKTKNYRFHPQYEPLKDYLKMRARKDPDGRLWVDQNVGKITKRKFDELKSEGRIFKTRTGRYRRKQYLDEMHGDIVDDVWEIPIINSQATERIGYPTQKPEALLERIISCASEKGNWVADFFCGSGTTLVIANKLRRRWIGVDQSKVAIEITKKRLIKNNALSFIKQRCTLMKRGVSSSAEKDPE
ncbi:MAG: site-specific DNA-methyltransferase [Promethearchaeota archaeon]